MKDFSHAQQIITLDALSIHWYSKQKKKKNLCAKKFINIAIELLKTIYNQKSANVKRFLIQTDEIYLTDITELLQFSIKKYVVVCCKNFNFFKNVPHVEK